MITFFSIFNFFKRTILHYSLYFNSLNLVCLIYLGNITLNFLQDFCNHHAIVDLSNYFNSGNFFDLFHLLISILVYSTL